MAIMAMRSGNDVRDSEGCMHHQPWDYGEAHCWPAGGRGGGVPCVALLLFSEATT